MRRELDVTYERALTENHFQYGETMRHPIFRPFGCIFALVLLAGVAPAYGADQCPGDPITLNSVTTGNTGGWTNDYEASCTYSSEGPDLV
jgi:hypothetical protein